MTIITSRPTGLTPERINELSRNFWNSAVLRAGIKLGVFPLLEERSHTPDNLAAKIGANPRFVQAFLEACVELELAQNDGDSFCNSPLSSSFLLPGKHDPSSKSDSEGQLRFRSYVAGINCVVSRIRRVLRPSYRA